MKIKNNILWVIIMFGLFGISYWLSRYAFFEMHGMKQWPNLLAILSIAILVIATILGNKIISAAIVIGYMGGFLLAMTFNTDGIDQGGGRTNNAWIIWGAFYCFSILIGLILNFISKQKHKYVK